MGYYSDSDSSEGSTDWTPLVDSLAELAHDHPPYVVGILPLPPAAFNLHYVDVNGTARYVIKHYIGMNLWSDPRTAS